MQLRVNWNITLSSYQIDTLIRCYPYKIWPENPAASTDKHTFIFSLHILSHQNSKKVLETGHYFNHIRTFSRSTTEHVTVANICCQKLPRTYVYGALLTWSVCVCVCVCVSWRVGLAECHAAGSHHRTNYFLSFALLRSPAFFPPLCRSLHLSLLLQFSVCLILILQACLFVSQDLTSQLTPESCRHSHLPCTDWYNSAPLVMLLLPLPDYLQYSPFLNYFARIIIPFNQCRSSILDFLSSCLATRLIDSDVKCL